MIPTCLDEIVRDARAQVARLRREYDQEDFDFLIRDPLIAVLRDMGHSERTVQFTINAVFGRD